MGRSDEARDRRCRCSPAPHPRRALGAAYQWLATRRDLAATPPPGQLVDIGGYRLHLWCIGAGAPAVVLESGLGGGAADAIHRELQRDLLALSTRSCQMIAARSDHAIAGDEPELVVKAIESGDERGAGWAGPSCVLTHLVLKH